MEVQRRERLEASRVATINTVRVSVKRIWWAQLIL